MAPQISSHEEFLYTEFNVIDEDDVMLEQFESALQRVPDEENYAEFPQLHSLHQAAASDVYSDCKEQDVLHLFPLIMLDEARAGRITALVLDRHRSNLKQYQKENAEAIDKDAFMAALESAIRRLHSLGVAHNDLNPGNVLVNAEGMPVLIDFGSCRAVGEKLGPSRGTAGWIEDLHALEKIRTWLNNPAAA
ncbi:kinase-like protein [Achaetomium macrosporum]|uniref:Kinase-like protein n=1 Tax=Achaetomium macrosporum TaxID=79813 RepID=A0AAN7C0S4_9PEZI|nr:kinase-like protein [Achaetomium macrosporum]